jgi:hypothetical protein
LVATSPTKPAAPADKPRLTKLVRRASAEAGTAAKSPLIPTQRTIKTASGAATFFVGVGSTGKTATGERRHKRLGSDIHAAIGPADPFPNLRRVTKGSPGNRQRTKEVKALGPVYIAMLL